jgi:hypothetical protein
LDDGCKECAIKECAIKECATTRKGRKECATKRNSRKECAIEQHVHLHIKLYHKSRATEPRNIELFATERPTML